VIIILLKDALKLFTLLIRQDGWLASQERLVRVGDTVSPLWVSPSKREKYRKGKERRLKQGNLTEEEGLIHLTSFY